MSMIALIIQRNWLAARVLTGKYTSIKHIIYRYLYWCKAWLPTCLSTVNLRGQVSGKCLSQLPSPPTTSPTGSDGLDFYYPDYDTAWNRATCKNDAPMPFLNKNDRPNYSSKEACCTGAYGGQSSHACMCDVDPCFSCKCGDILYRFQNQCTNKGHCGDDDAVCLIDWLPWKCLLYGYGFMDGIIS